MGWWRVKKHRIRFKFSILNDLETVSSTQVKFICAN